MKSTAQLIEQGIHKLARRKVRAAAQAQTVRNIIENEMQSFIADILNEQLQKEQTELLGRDHYQRSLTPRYRNGFKLLRLRGIFSKLVVRKPVLRSQTPPSAILSMFKVCGQGFIALLASRFWLRGASTRAVAAEINNAFGTKISASTVSKFSDSFLPEAQKWLEQTIPPDIKYLFVDALYLPVRKAEFTAKQALLVALGVSKSGQRFILGFLLGDRESIDSWNALFKDLLARGLQRNAIALAISDDHKAIRAAIEQTFAVPHQLCVVHKMRNALARVAAPHRKKFYADFTAAFWADSRENALLNLGRLHANWFALYPKAAQIACAEPERFLCFFDQPKHLWTLLRSSNLIERFNRELRRRLRPAGAMQSESELWKLVASVSFEQQNRWNKRKINHSRKQRLAA